MPQGDATALARAIVEMAADPKLRERYGSKLHGNMALDSYGAPTSTRSTVS